MQIPTDYHTSSSQLESPTRPANEQIQFQDPYKEIQLPRFRKHYILNSHCVDYGDKRIMIRDAM
jgi:hypothetical protein